VRVHDMISHRQVPKTSGTAGKVASFLPPRHELAVGRPETFSIRSAEPMTVNRGMSVGSAARSAATAVVQQSAARSNGAVPLMVHPEDELDVVHQSADQSTDAGAAAVVK